MSRLVVLGSCGAWPEAGRACSGFLLEHEGFRVVLDLGYGTLPRLLAHLGSSVADGLDAVVVTHHHPDHVADLHGLFRARWFGRRDAAPLPLYAPAGVVRVLTDLEDGDAAPIERVFDRYPLPGGPYTLGPFRLESRALPHHVENAGVRLASETVTVAYTGDTGPDPAVTALGRDADLFVVEASDRDQQPTTPGAPEGNRFHLTAARAGAHATDAGARRLLLTHFWPGNDRARSHEDAQATFEGDVLLAEEDLAVPLP